MKQLEKNERLYFNGKCIQGRCKGLYASGDYVHKPNGKAYIFGVCSEDERPQPRWYRVNPETVFPDVLEF